MWSIFDYLMPGFLFTYRKFKTMFEIPIVKRRMKKCLRISQDDSPIYPEKAEIERIEGTGEARKGCLFAPEGKQKELLPCGGLKTPPEP